MKGSVGILKLNVIRKWFNRHLEDKNEDYREITGYWVTRLLCYDDNKIIRGKKAEHIAELILKHGLEYVKKTFSIKNRAYSLCEIKNGYGKFSHTIIKQYRSYVTVGIGNPEWGAPDHKVFIIKLGKIHQIK